MGKTFFVLFTTIHAFDRDGRTGRQRDGWTAFSWLDRVACNACNAVKTEPNL